MQSHNNCANLSLSLLCNSCMSSCAISANFPKNYEEIAIKKLVIYHARPKTLSWSKNLCHVLQSLPHFGEAATLAKFYNLPNSRVLWATFALFLQNMPRFHEFGHFYSTHAMLLCFFTNSGNFCCLFVNFYNLPNILVCFKQLHACL